MTKPKDIELSDAEYMEDLENQDIPNNVFEINNGIYFTFINNNMLDEDDIDFEAQDDEFNAFIETHPFVETNQYDNILDDIVFDTELQPVVINN